MQKKCKKFAESIAAWRRALKNERKTRRFILPLIWQAPRTSLYFAPVSRSIPKGNHIKSGRSCKLELLRIAYVSESRHRRARYGARKILFGPRRSLRLTRFERFHNRMSGEHGVCGIEISCVSTGWPRRRRTSGSTAKRRHTQSAAESASPTRSEAEWKLNAQSTVMLIDLYSAILLARRGSVLNCGIYVLS